MSNWEKRWHPLRREWVVYAAHRNQRPWAFPPAQTAGDRPLQHDPGCYLCPRNRRVSGLENPDYTGVYVFDNDHPVVGQLAPEVVSIADQEVQAVAPARGLARVICYDPAHHKALGDLPVSRIATVVQAWKAQTEAMLKQPDIKSILIFENRGEAVGVSNPHPHGQVYALDYADTFFLREYEAAQAHRTTSGTNLFEVIVQAEQRDNKRILAENEHFIAFVPYFARYAYEVYVLPKRHFGHLAEATEFEVMALAAILKPVLQAFDCLFRMPFPYVLALRQALVDGEQYPEWRFYLHFQPPLRQPGLVKFLAGPEIGFGCFMADTMPEAKAAELQQALTREVTAEAPGRLDVMGGIADYSGSWVLQLPIEEKATVRAAFRTDGLLRLHSTTLNATFEWDMADFDMKIRQETPKSALYAWCKNNIQTLTEGHWAAYVAGACCIFWIESGLPLRGLNLVLDSQVPPGKGLSSSAAIEVAALRALTQLYGYAPEGTGLAHWAQMAENHIAGAPCGLMDQLAVHLGRPGHLLPILCQPDRVLEPVRIPAGVRFEGIDSGVRHAVSGASYGDVRAAAFMGYSILATHVLRGAAQLRTLIPEGREALPWQGYLCNIDVATFERDFRMLLPVRMTGRDFLAQYGSTIDELTTISPDQSYAVRACTAHPILENERVQQFQQLLQSIDEQRLTHDQSYRNDLLGQLGALMYAAHEGYSACGLGHTATDAIVASVRQQGWEAGFYGAKITGGGSGGTVCVLRYDAGK
jgi:galactose-1-phosphate uridylyltransferase (family 1)